MKIEWFRSATVGLISDDGSSILCDPWITDGAFLGSWYHFPPLEGTEFEELLSRTWDAVFVSHLHADHFDRKFLRALSQRQPHCVAIIPAFAHSWLKRAIENCGFSGERLIEAKSGDPVSVGTFRATVYVADHCDPSICGVSVPCHNRDPRLAAFDSLALFEADNQKVLNANDALAVQSTSRVVPVIGEVDVLLGHYGGAGPFPQCFVDLSEQEKIEKAKTLAHSFLFRLTNAAKIVKAKYVMPFAGQYVLGGRLAPLNRFRSVVSLSEALKWVAENSESIAIGMKPFTGFDVASGICDEPWVEPSREEIAQYVERISQHQFPYEKSDQDWDSAEADLENALLNVGDEYLRRVSLGIEATTHRISIETTRVSGFIDFLPDSFQVHVEELGEMQDSETRLTCHPGLLKGLIQRAAQYSGFTPMHFNQAEIGSHFEWKRTGPFNEVVRCLNFMQVSHRTDGASRKQLLLT